MNLLRTGFIIFLLLHLVGCSKDDQNTEVKEEPIPEEEPKKEEKLNLDGLELTILPEGVSTIKDTDLTPFSMNIINSSNESISYKELTWTSDIDGNLSNQQFGNRYFLSVNTHEITCHATLPNDSIVSKTFSLLVEDDIRGDWKIQSNYNGVGSDTFTPDALSLHTSNFIIYSNTSDPYIRLIISEFAHQVLEEIQVTFDKSSFDFNGKITIAHDKNAGNGFISSYPNFGMYVGMPEDGFVPLNGGWNFNIEGIKHELMHLVELTYMLPSPTEYTSHRWFWEGIAVLISQGEMYTTWQEVSDWKNDNEYNPITKQNQPSGNTSSDGHYYPMYGLSVAYLLDIDGLGKEYSDVIALYESVKTGATFEEAFESHFGMTVTQYENNYYSIMESYLN